MNRGRSRPWHLAPWIGLAATVVLWPGRKLPPAGMSEDRIMSPEAFDHAEPGRGRKAHFPHTIPPMGWRDFLWRTFWEITIRAGAGAARSQAAGLWSRLAGSGRRPTS